MIISIIVLSSLCLIFLILYFLAKLQCNIYQEVIERHRADLDKLRGENYRYYDKLKSLERIIKNE